MNCKDALQAMHEVLDGGAPPERLAALQGHLRECEACAREYRALSHWDTVLRAPEPDEPGDAYFDSLARRIATGVRERDAHRERAPRLVPSWGFSWGFAAACLVLGLLAGHAAFPRTVTRMQKVVQTVPGPARTVTVEKVIKQPVQVPVRVEVPVVRWRTRTVVRSVPGTEGSLMVGVRTYAGAPSPTPASAALQPTTPVPDVHLAGTSWGTGTGTRLAAYYSGVPTATADTGLTRAEMSALARRLAADVTAIDERLDSPRMAETLRANVDRADAELSRAMEPAASAAGTP